MSSKTAMIVGVSGVGKTTFIRSLEGLVPFQLLSAGSLIKAERERQQKQIDRDALRFENISDNQSLLIDGFRRAKDHSVDLVILDGHTVIDIGNGIELIPADVFRALGIGMFVFVEAEPQAIVDRRKIDASRQRPELSADTIARHQTEALRHTRHIAQEVSVPTEVVTASDNRRLATLLRNWLRDGDDRA